MRSISLRKRDTLKSIVGDASLVMSGKDLNPTEVEGASAQSNKMFKALKAFF